MDKLITLEAEIVTDTKLIVEGAAEVKINASESITAEIAPDTYVLGSIGSFNTASSWVGAYVNELVRESIGAGGSLKDALDLIRTDVMDQIEIGVNQTITQVENEFVSNSTLATTLGSEIGGVRASILDVKSTYATKTQAQAYSVDAIKASFGGDASSSAIEAYIGNIAVAKVDADSATAATVTTLIASMNNQTVRIDEMDEVLITTEGWAASASKLITAPDGSITGWEFADGSGVQSQFKVYADNFVIQGATNPIEYDNSAVVLPKTYEQSNAPTSGMLIGDTWIDTDDSYKVYTYTSTGWKAAIGNKTYAQISAPTSGMIANDVWYDTDDNNKPYYYTGSVWSAIRDGTIATAQATANSAQSAATTAYNAAIARVLPADVANAVNTNTTTINGSKITTGSVNAAVLSATAIYGKTINITDSSASGGTLPDGTSSLGYFDTSRDKNALGAVNRASGGYAISGLGTNTSSSVGVHGRGNWGVLGEAIGGGFGFYTTSSCYFEGANYPFTGAHLCLCDELPEVGDILSAYDAYNLTVDNSIPYTALSASSNDAKVFGVYNGKVDDLLTSAANSSMLGEKTEDGRRIKPEYEEYLRALVPEYLYIGANALGEGGINVCSAGGNISAGDYITTSDISGKGMKQEDNIMHNYTVAKALESVDWTTEQSTTKMIACTYHCG